MTVYNSFSGINPPLVLYDGDQFIGDYRDPPTGVVDHQNKNLIEIAGSNITIKNLVIDYAFYDGWKNYIACIKFKRGDSSYVGKNINIENVQFIDTADTIHPEITGNGAGDDSWGINFSTEGRLENIYIRGCRNHAKYRQLCAGGGQSTRQNINVFDCLVEAGYANPIAISAFCTGVIDGVNIYNNRLYNCTNVGIFVGRDSDDNRCGDDPNDNILKNVNIYNNFIHYTSGAVSEFPQPILVKGGTVTPPENIFIDHNTIDTMELLDLTGTSPRSIVVQGPADADTGNIQVFGGTNIIYGRGQPPVVNANSALIWNPDTDKLEY